MLPTLAQVCTLAAPFETDVADYAAAQCRAIEIYLGKLETYLDSHTTDDVQQLFESHRVTAPVASFQGGLFAADGPAREQHWELFARRLQICQQLQIRTLVVAADCPRIAQDEDIAWVRRSLGEAAGQAEPLGVRLALEFQAKAPFCNNLQTAVALVDEIQSPALGICLDAFHFCNGPSKLADLQLLTIDKLLHVQLCDVLARPRELATDADRVLPGDGDFPLETLVDHLRQLGYQGTVSVELMNPKIWEIPPLSFSEIAMTALRTVLGQADSAVQTQEE